MVKFKNSGEIEIVLELQNDLKWWRSWYLQTFFWKIKIKIIVENSQFWIFKNSSKIKKLILAAKILVVGVSDHAFSKNRSPVQIGGRHRHLERFLCETKKFLLSSCYKTFDANELLSYFFSIKSKLFPAVTKNLNFRELLHVADHIQKPTNRLGLPDDLFFRSILVEWARVRFQRRKVGLYCSVCCFLFQFFSSKKSYVMYYIFFQTTFYMFFKKIFLFISRSSFSLLIGMLIELKWKVEKNQRKLDYVYC